MSPGIDLSGLTLQSGTTRLVKDEYSAGAPVPNTSGMEIDGEIGAGVSQTIQHRPAQQNYNLSSLQPSPAGLKFNFVHLAVIFTFYLVILVFS